MSAERGGTGAEPLPLDKAPSRIAGMFDAIAGKYDLLNMVPVSYTHLTLPTSDLV